MLCKEFGALPSTVVSDLPQGSIGALSIDFLVLSIGLKARKREQDKAARAAKRGG